MTEPIHPTVYMPRREEPEKGMSKWWFLLQLVGVFVVCWALTLTFGYMAFRGEIDDIEKKHFVDQAPEKMIRSPLPFVLSARLQATLQKEGVVGKRTITRYYVWCFGYKKELASQSVPGIMTWVWPAEE